MKKICKRIIAMLLAATMLFSFAVPVFAVEGDPSLVIDKVQGVKGGSATVKLSLENNPGIAAATFKIVYDSTVLSLNAVDFNESFGGDFDDIGSLALPVSGFDTKKAVSISWSSMSNVSTSGLFLSLIFTVNENADKDTVADIEAVFSAGDFCDIDENDVNFLVTNGSVTVIEGVPGDINGDRVVNSKDLIRLRKYFSGWDVEVDLLACDCNGDGTVNSKDLIRLRKYFSGWDVELCYGPNTSTTCVHALEAVAAKAPTCTEDGNVAHWRCTKCGKYFSDAQGATELALAEITISATGHTAVIDPAVPATYESTGLTEGSHCSTCQEVLIAQETVPMLEAEQYSITYNISNGDTYLSTLDIENPNPSYYYSSSGLTLKNVSVLGYTFLGWYDLPSGSNAEIIKKIAVGEKENIELYAHWEKVPYTVQFESDLVPVSSIEYTVDKGATLPVPHLDGYTFIGWSNGDGEILKVIPVGTTGNKTYIANWLSERNKAWTKKTLDDPIIIEDEESNRILFTYEIGQIENVPLYEIENFGYINSEGVSKTVSKTYTVKTSKALMDQYAQNVANATTNSSQWSLSSGWSDAVTVNENYLTENNLSETDAKTLCTTDSSNWLISNGSSGSTTTTKYDSKHDLNTATGNTKTYNTHDESNSSTHKQSAEIDVKYEHKSNKLNPANVLLGENNFSIEANVGYEGARTKSSASKTGTETDAGSSDQTGNIKHTGTDTVSTGSWNSSSSYGGSKSVSESNSLSKTISERIATEKGYGKSYILDGGETSSQGLSTSSSSSSNYSSAVTYGTDESATETVEYTTSNTKTGYHRYIKAGTAHVFAVVCYDIKTAAYSVLTYTVMDDEMHNFEDYSYQSAAYNDNQSGVISFEVPYFVEEYVLSRVGETDGLEVNSAGMITGYTGLEKTVIIPEYRVVDNLDGTKKVLKITGISSSALAGNTAITGIQLSDFITEIPDNAFEGCTSLETIDMSCVQSIGKEAFKNCTNINYVFLNDDVISLGDEAFGNIETFAVYTKNISIITGAINSGAKNILIYTCDGCSALNDRKLSISAETETFVFNGRGNEFNNLSISSNAQNTIINNCKIISTTGLPLKISSENVQLGQIDISSIGIALILSGNSCNMGLYGESKVSTSSDNAMVGKNITVSKTENAIKKGVFSELEIKGNILVCGTKAGSELLNCDGSVITIDEETFQNYVNGMYKLTFDANSGSVSQTEKTVFYGLACGELPVPSRQYYTFDGWFTDAVGGAQITEEHIYTETQDTVLYAHWTLNSFVVTFDANGGLLDTASTRGYCGVVLGDLPTPTRDYYSFDGWFTEAEGGDEVTSSTTYNLAVDSTLYAHWTIHPLSDWVNADEVPDDAQPVTTKWTYTLREYAEGAESSKDGWVRYDERITSYGSEIGPVYSNPTGNNRIVTPENYEISRTHYYRYYHYANSPTKSFSWSQLGDYQNYRKFDLTYRLTIGADYDGYKYYHSAPNGNTVQGKYYVVWYDTEWDDIQYGTRWYYQEPIYTYYYYRDLENQEAFSDPTGQENVSNVIQLVQYRAK